MDMSMAWADDALTVTLKSFTNDEDGSLITEILGEITATPEEWLDIVICVLDALPGKPNAAKTEFAWAPAGAADPDLVGALIATKLKALRERRGF